MQGTSPRMRGKPRLYTTAIFGVEEHPRVCGENSAAAARSGDPGGTSPRMRGKLLGGNYELARERNIPAYAGKTNSFPPLPM